MIVGNNINSKLVISLVLILVIFQQTIAQTDSPKINFTNISSGQGLSNNFVNDIIQDSLGFIWVATTDGLCRYDSKDDFKVFYQNGDLELKSSNVRSILADSKNKLWIGTRLGGLTCYDQITGESKTYLHNEDDPNSISNNEILSLLEDSKGRIWAGTEFGLNLFNPKDNSFSSWVADINNPNALRQNAVLEIVEDSRGLIWVGTWEGGLALVINSDSENPNDISFRSFDIGESVASANVWTVIEDNKKRLWIGTHGGGLYMTKVPQKASNKNLNQDWDLKIIPLRIKNNQNLNSSTIDDLHQDCENNLWLASTVGVLYLEAEQVEEDINENTILNFDSYKYDAEDNTSIAGTVINKIFEDKDHTFWVGSINGLSKFNMLKKQIEYLPVNVNEDINHLNNNIALQTDELAWVCAEYGGLFRYNIAEKKAEKVRLQGIPDGTKFYTIEIENENLVIGTNIGVVVVNPKTGRSKIYEVPNKISKKTNFLFSRYIFIDDSGLIYLATEFGLVTLDRAKNQFKYHSKIENDSTSLSDNSLNQIFQTSDGTVWIASYKGLNKIVSNDEDGITFKSYLNANENKETSLSSNQIICLEEIDEQLYIGTTYGLNRLDLKTDQVTNMTQSSNKFIVLSLESTSNGMLWLSTSEGITRYNPKTKQNRNYDWVDGISDNNFRIITSESSDDFVYFGSHNGISKVDISEKYENKAPPLTYITEANIINKDGQNELALLGVNEISLAANNYYVAIKFIGLDYDRMEKTQYAYMLEGLDEEWFYPNKNIPAVYTNLKAGDYVFKSKTANNEGEWSEVSELRIIKESAFLERPWVRFFLILLGLFLLIYCISLYTKSIKKNNSNLNKEITERKKIEEDLVQTNKDLQQFAYGASHDLQEPLRNIGNAVGLLKRKNELDTNSEEYVEIAVDGVKRMSSLIENLLTYAKSGSKAVTIETADLNKIVAEKIKDLSQMIASKNAKVLVQDLPEIQCEVNQIGIVFYNLINNGIKFNKSDDPIVKVGCHEKEDHWEFFVEDNGIGIQEDYQSKIFSIFTRLENRREYEGTGIGLSLCQKIVNRHNGKIWIRSTLNEGATFFFTIQKNLESGTD